MKQTSKKVISLLMALTMVMGMMTAMTVSAAVKIEKDYTITFDEYNAIGMVATNSNAATSIDTTEGVGGTNSLKSIANKDVTGNLRAFNIPKDTITWEKGAQYTISFMAKTSKTMGLYVAANFAYLDYSDVARNYPAKTFSEITTGWQEYSFTFDVKDFINSKSDPTSLNKASLDAVVMVNMVSPSKGDTLWIDNFKVTKTIPPTAPVVDSVVIEGKILTDHTITAKAVITDRNEEDVVSASYQWQVKNGGDWDDITDADSQEYTIPVSMVGKQLRVKVTPKSNQAPYEGTPDFSEATEAVIEYIYPPSGKGAVMKGDFLIGKTLTADYTYIPSKSNVPKGEAEYCWEISSDNKNFTPISNATNQTYLVQGADLGKWVRVGIIPKDEKGTAGEKIFSSATRIDAAVSYYVSTTGSDSNDGSLEKPFKTITKARDTIYNLALPEGGVVVNIMGGTYPVSSTMAFNRKYSGTETSPIVYQAYNGEKVVFSGSQSLDTSKIQKVTDEELLDKLIDEKAKDHLYMLDLDEQGITMTALKSYGHGYSYSPKQIYMNNNLLIDARWPNDDQSQNLVQCRPLTNADDGINESLFNAERKPIKFEYPDLQNRSAKWDIKSGDAYVGGAVVYFWAPVHLLIDSIDVENKVVTSLDSSRYGSLKGSAGTVQNKVYFSNIFAEIDKPGESYIDREKNILYFYPIGTMENPTVEVVTRTGSMVAFSYTSYISFKGIDFKNTVSTPVTISNSDNIVIEDAEIANSTVGGITVTDCTNTIITGCNFHTIGTTAITIDGGDRENLIPSGNEIKNNIFHNITLRASNDFTAMYVKDAVGEWIHHNEFNDMKTYVLRISNSNDILFEYNKVMNAGTLNSDAGVINWGREFDSLGHTVRYNYFENIGSKLVSNYLHAEHSVSIFTDDSSTGGNIYGNVFLNGGSNKDGTGSVTVGNGPEFANVWGNISICTDFDRMSKSFLMRSWADTANFKDKYGVTVPAGTAVSSWTYQMSMGDAFGRTSSNYFNEEDLELMWSDTWIKHYKGTQWENALAHYSEVNYTGAKALYDAGDYKGLLTFLVNNLTHERTNKIHNNVSLGATTMDSLADHYDNYNGTQGAITAQDKALFVDFDNKDFTLTNAGLAKIQAKAPEFKPILFNEIGLTSLVGGYKPVVTINPEKYTVTADELGISPSYTFADADGDEEGNTKIYWYVSDTENGKYEQIYGDVEGNYFEVTDEYLGKYLKYEVVPYDTTVLRGESVMSGPIRLTKVNVSATAGPNGKLMKNETQVKDTESLLAPGTYTYKAIPDSGYGVEPVAVTSGGTTLPVTLNGNNEFTVTISADTAISVTFGEVIPEIVTDSMVLPDTVTEGESQYQAYLAFATIMGVDQITDYGMYLNFPGGQIKLKGLTDEKTMEMMAKSNGKFAFRVFGEGLTGKTVTLVPYITVNGEESLGEETEELTYQ